MLHRTVRPALLAACLASPPAAIAADAPGRIASLNLCTDGLLVSLADPERIVGLGPYARDAARSWLAADTGRFRILSGGAEEVLALRPDLVLAGSFTRRTTRDMLTAHGLRLVTFPPAASIDAARAQIAAVGDLVGRPERAAERIAAIDAALARARAAIGGRSLSVLPLQRRGWVAGRDTLTTSLLAAIGLRNAGAELSRYGGQVTLEALTVLRPDLLLVSGAALRAPEDQGSALLLHPALRRLYPPSRRLVVPEQMTVCGGPELARAIDALATAVAAIP